MCTNRDNTVCGPHTTHNHLYSQRRIISFTDDHFPLDSASVHTATLASVVAYSTKNFASISQALFGVCSPEENRNVSLYLQNKLAAACTCKRVGFFCEAGNEILCVSQYVYYTL